MWTEIVNKSDERKKDCNDIPDIVKEALLCKKLNKLKNAPSSDRFIKFDDSNNKKCLSLTDIKHDTNQDLWESDDYKSRRKTNKRYYNTITDPNFPVFRSDGVQVTHSLYSQYIASHYQELNQDTETSKSSKRKLNSTDSEKLKNDSILKQKSKIPSNLKLQNISKQEVHRSALSLPLKPLNVLENEEKSKSTVFEKQRKLDGLQLTPLMSKLSLIIDEKKGGFETTPSEFRDFSNYSSLTNNIIKNKLDSLTNEHENDEIDFKAKIKNSVEKTELFLCGHQNMVLMLLLENGMCSDPELIHSLVSIYIYFIFYYSHL